ncbi:MAG: hypothetical protein V1871_03225 [Planctomycetota bacterium]
MIGIINIKISRPYWLASVLLVIFIPLLIFGKSTPKEYKPEYSNSQISRSPQHPNTDNPYHHIAAAIHLQTPISGGKRSLNDYLQLAKQHEIGILIITDHDNQHYEYGIWPFRWLLKKTFEEASVFKYGVENYFSLLKQAGSSSQPEADLPQAQGSKKKTASDNDVLVIDGVESMPFYYWGGSYFKKNLSLNDRGKHLLVIGLNDINAYKNLPLIANGKSRFNQYNGSQGYAPYQDLIDYVNSKGGLIFWSHPEAKESKLISGIKINTLAYPEAIKATTNYTGFGIFWEGYQKIGLPNGIWDNVLKEYCDGRRSKPVWAIGELDDYGEKEINKLLTVLLLKQKSYQTAIDALRNGKMYTVLKAQQQDYPPLMLDDFCLYNIAQQSIAYSGDELLTSSTPIIKIRISQKENKTDNQSNQKNNVNKHMVTLKIIRQGIVIREINQSLPLTLNFKDNYSPKHGERIYYRLEATDEKGGRLISNPIFVRFQ